MNLSELCVHCWADLDGAVSDAYAIPSCPELCVSASMSETDVSYPGAIILERMGHLQKRNIERVTVMFNLQPHFFQGALATPT